MPATPNAGAISHLPQKSALFFVKKFKNGSFFKKTHPEGARLSAIHFATPWVPLLFFLYDVFDHIYKFRSDLSRLSAQARHNLNIFFPKHVSMRACVGRVLRCLFVCIFFCFFVFLFVRLYFFVCLFACFFFIYVGLLFVGLLFIVCYFAHSLLACMCWLLFVVCCLLFVNLCCVLYIAKNNVRNCAPPNIVLRGYPPKRQASRHAASICCVPEATR